MKTWLFFFPIEWSDFITTMLKPPPWGGVETDAHAFKKNVELHVTMKYPQCWCYLFLPIGNHSQISRVPVAIKVLDVNDNAPEFASEYEAFLCENGKPGQVNISMLLMLICLYTTVSYLTNLRESVHLPWFHSAKSQARNLWVETERECFSF